MRQVLTLGIQRTLSRATLSVAALSVAALSVAALGVGVAGCGSERSAGGRASIVVTTNILGDIVSAVVGELADVEVIMPLGADPHDFAPSAKQAASMEGSDLLVVNGAGFEQGMSGVIENVTDGDTPVFAFADAIDLLHPDADGVPDPHFWTDPARVIAAVEALAAALVTVDDIDPDVLGGQVAGYITELESLDAEIETALRVVPPQDRVLVTNHEALGYFADRYGFELVGAVVPSLTASAETSARELEQLAEVIRTENIPAIFAETTQSTDLAEALADEVGGEIAIVELYTESLGGSGSGAETYIDLMRTNAALIVAALTGP